MTDHSKLIRILGEASVYCSLENEDMRIDYHDNDTQTFVCTGEETGEEYCIKYDEVDLDNDRFYKLTLMEY